jgi:predicted transcriptional regulator of viral defense system
LELVGAITLQPHLVTAGRALEAHGLTDQSFREIIVATPVKERDWNWQGEYVRYVRLPRHQLWGGRRRGDTVIASAERAILDSLAHPNWGVTLSQVVEALDRAYQGDRRFLERLAAATARYRNAMLARRVGFLVEETIGAAAAEPFLALRGPSNADAALLTGLKRRGPRRSRWNVNENVPMESLIDHREVG